MTAVRKYAIVFNALQREILEGRFSNGKRLPSEAELCLHYKVSRPTAARALLDLQHMGIITRRAGSGSYVVLPRTAESSTSRTIGLFVPGLGNTEILDPICNEITRSAQSLDCTVLWGDAATPIRTGEDAWKLCAQFIEKRVDGVLFAPMESIPDRELWNRRIADEFVRHAIPLALLDRDLGEFPSRSEFDLIGIDNVAAAIALTDHLLHHNRRRICFLARPHFPSTTDLRLLGCREAIRRHGIEKDYQLAHFGDPADAQFVQKVLRVVKPDAIVCSNDQTAALLMRTLTSLKRKVPGAIAVAGFDDVQYATILSPSLTTVQQPCRELGRSAVKTLLERIANPELPPRLILHSHQLVIRESTLGEHSAEGE
jgi:DNA-binding LacI/PurR family transcriptional regulator